MPHLSPMWWLTAIFLFWTMSLMMTSRFWWASDLSSHVQTTEPSSLTQKWHWLQGGRDSQ